ncbi:MAG: acyl-CoA thioesterase [Thermoguttaceae bacterium]
MAHQFRYRRRVEFSETDMAGIVHFTNYFRYMEAAEQAFLRSLGLSVHQDRDGRVVGWPRVAVDCSYSRPLRFEEEFEIRLSVRAKHRASLTYGFVFVDDRDRTVAAGSMKVACVDYDRATGRMKSIAIPDDVWEQIEESPPTGPDPCRDEAGCPAVPS